MKRFIACLAACCLLVRVLPSASYAADVAIGDLAGSASDQSDTYSISLDTSLYEIATDAGIMPLSTSTPTYWEPADMVKILNSLGVGSNMSVGLYARLVALIGSVDRIAGFLQTSDYRNVAQLLSSLDNRLKNALDQTFIGSVGYNSSGLYRLLNSVVDTRNTVTTADDSIRVRNLVGDPLYAYISGGSMSVDLQPVVNQLGFPDGKSFWKAGYNIPVSNGNLQSNVSFSEYMNLLIRSRFIFSAGGFMFLNEDGNFSATTLLSTTGILRFGLNGLASILRGASGSQITGNLISSADLSETAFSANNLLSMLSPLLDLQNDVARITNVIADPTDQALNEANKENKEELVNSFDGSSGAGVKKDDIGDMASVSGDLTGQLDTGVTIGDAFTQIGDSDNLSFFSSQCAAALDTVPVTFADRDDDFVHYYDPENKALFELLGRGGDEE